MSTPDLINVLLTDTEVVSNIWQLQSRNERPRDLISVISGSSEFLFKRGAVCWESYRRLVSKFYLCGKHIASVYLGQLDRTGLKETWHHNRTILWVPQE